MIDLYNYTTGNSSVSSTIFPYTSCSIGGTGGGSPSKISLIGNKVEAQGNAGLDIWNILVISLAIIIFVIFLFAKRKKKKEDEDKKVK